MHRLSIPEIHLLCYNYKHTVYLCTICYAKREKAFQKLIVAQNIIHSLLILYNVYGHGTVLSQELNWCQWKSVAYAPRSLAETKHIGIMSWGGALPNTIGMYTSLPKGLLWTHNLSFSNWVCCTYTCIKQMTLWRWTNPIAISTVKYNSSFNQQYINFYVLTAALNWDSNDVITVIIIIIWYDMIWYTSTFVQQYITCNLWSGKL